MKIILSPSKTQDFSTHYKAPMTQPMFEGKAITLNNQLKRLSKKDLKDLMKIDGDLLDQTYRDIRSFQGAEPNQAIATYTGLVFKYFDLDAYGKEEFDYLNSHLHILSAKYGILRPYDGIRPYRLDMKMKPKGKDLYKFWQKDMDAYFAKEDIIIDLASNEFSRLVNGNKVTVGFRDYKEGHYKNLATYAKMARGMLLHEMVLNKIDSVEALKTLTFGDYSYNDEISTATMMIFSRTT